MSHLADGYDGSDGSAEESGSAYSVYLEVTRRCNFLCDYCYACGNPAENDFLTLNQIIEIIEKSLSWGAKFLTISGGEPFLRPDTISIIEYASSRCHTNIITNASLIDMELGLKLASLSNISLSVSLDGSTAEINDIHRGVGSFSAAVRGIKNLLKAGLRKFISLCMTVNADNFRNIENYAAFASGLGIQSIVLTPAVIIGRASEKRNGLFMNQEQLLEYYQSLFGLEKKYKEKLKISGSLKTSLKKRMDEKSSDLPCSICRSIAVDYRGEVYPCSLMMLPQFSMGNALKSNSLEEICKSGEEVFRKIAVERKDKVEKCSLCRLKDVCAAGCPARSYFEYGSFDYPDPDCIVINNLI